MDKVVKSNGAGTETNGDNIKKMMAAKVDEIATQMATIGAGHTIFKVTVPGPFNDDLGLTLGVYVDVLVERGFAVISHGINTSMLPDGNCFTVASLLVKRGSIIPATRLLTS